MTDFTIADKMTNITNSKPKPGWHAWGGRFFLVAFLLWIVTITYSAQGTAWFGTMTFNSGLDWDWVYASWIMVGLTAVPLLPLALWWPHSRYQAVFQTWLAATLVPLLLAPTRLFYPTQSQAVLLTPTLPLLLLAAAL